MTGMNAQGRVAEIERFLNYVMNQWAQDCPAVVMTGKVARRCERCILSENAAPLKDGLCPFCRAAEGEQQSSPRPPDTPTTKSGMEGGKERLAGELAALLRTYEGQGGGGYDALVLFSGGKDSALLLHRLRSEHPGLRLLAVTVDNGFFSAVAMANAQRIVERIEGVDHLVFRPRTELFVKTFRHAFTHLNEGGCYTTVDRMDGDLVFDIGRNLAAMLEIPLMIAGLSGEQARRVLGLDHFESPRGRELSRREASAGFTLTDLYTTDELRYWWDGGRWGEQRVPRVVYPFVAWDYDEAAVRQEVVRLGLIEQGADNPLITNNDTVPVMLAVDMAQQGYSGFELEFAEMVRQGRADRMMWLAVAQAIEHLVSQGRFLPHCIADTLGRLGLTEQDVGIPKLVLDTPRS